MRRGLVVRSEAKPSEGMATSSAMASSLSGTVRRRTLAVSWLMTSSSLAATEQARRRSIVISAPTPPASSRATSPRTCPAARSAARRFADRFEDQYPAAVACLRNDLDELLTCFRYKTEAERRAVRTTNAVERRFREVRRRTRPMGTFQDKTSMDRILFAVFTHENKSQGVSTPFLLTQNN